MGKHSSSALMTLVTRDLAEPFDAVVAGHICLDVIPDLSVHPEFRLEALLRPGHLVEIGPAAFSTGGPVSNTGLALHRLGIRTLLMGKVGNDLFGQAVRQIVASYDPHLAEGMVIDEVQKGYTFGDRVIRYSKVIVAKAARKEEKEENKEQSKVENKEGKKEEQEAKQ